MKQDLAQEENRHQQEIGKLKREHQDRVEQWKMNYLYLKDCRFPISEFQLLVITNWKLNFLLKLFVEFHIFDSQHFRYWKFGIHQIISTKALISRF